MAHWSFAAPRALLRDGDTPAHGCNYNVFIALWPVIAEAYSARDAEVLRKTLHARYGDSLVIKIDGERAPANIPLV